MPDEKRIRPAGNRTDSKITNDAITTIVPPTDGSAYFQVMPDLAPEQYDALKADIETNGIVVPVVVDQHGRTIDGHNRRAIADELGIECPVEVRHVADDDAAYDLALTLNLARRHLSQEQKRELIRAEMIRRPDDSDRSIARRVGCSPSTVGTARAEWRAEAEESTRRAREAIRKSGDCLAAAAMLQHREGGMSWQTVGDLLERLSWGKALEKWDGDRERNGIDLLEDMFVPIYGEFFDSIRAYDCPADCEICKPVVRQWRDAHPRQVYRHSEPPEVSNLDSQAVSADA